MSSPKKLADELREGIDTAYAVGGAALSAGGSTVLAYMVPSPTMRAFVALAAGLGIVLALLRIGYAWYGVSQERRNRRSVWNFLFAFLAFVAFYLVLWTLNPENASKYEWVERLRELLLVPAVTANLAAAFFTLVASYFLTAALVILSPSLKRQRPKPASKADEPLPARPGEEG